MSKAFLHDLRADSLAQEHGGVGVPRVVDPAGDAGRLEDASAGTSTDPGADAWIGTVSHGDCRVLRALRLRAPPGDGSLTVRRA